MGINAVASSQWLREGMGRFGGSPVGLVLDARVRDPRAIAAGVDVAAQVDFPDAVTFTPPSVVEMRTWLALGVPVVASDRANAASVVRDRVDGRLLPPANRNAFIRVLMRLVDEPGLVTDMAHAAAATHGRGLPIRRPNWIWDSRDHSAGGRSFENPMAASR
jgi:glycosyltransferase involved in cell wall biosynthesis